MIVFRDARIFDGTGAPSFPGHVIVDGPRIHAVERGSSLPEGGTVFDLRGATLMPGLTEAHAHVSWPSSIERPLHVMQLPPEDLALTAARNLRIMLDHGYTSAYSAGALSKTLEVTLKSHLDDGGFPGPRFVPSSVEREPPADNHEITPGMVQEHGRGPEAMRRFVRECAEMGAKVVKLLINGENALKAGASHELLYTEEEVAAAGEESRAAGLWLSAHTHSSAGVQMALRHGVRVLYHCTYADEATIDALVAHKDSIFVGPSAGILQHTLDANPPPHIDMRYQKEDAARALECQKRVIPELKRRGVRILPGGDYGFPFQPHGREAFDLELFVRHFGYTPAEVLAAATHLGGQLMGLGDELGRISPGCLADLLVVAGDPTEDVRVLQDKRNLLAIMKDGRFHKQVLA